MERRHFLHIGAAASAGLLAGQVRGQSGAFAGAHASAEEGARQAHGEIWRRFVDAHGILLDFTRLDGSVSLPTPEECRDGKPNALGWWSPIENGAMFNGLYMDALVTRWRVTKQPDAADKARRLMSGLLLLASLSEVQGFVGRGVSTDGRSHYPMGSDDQTLPWFLGLWRYLEAGLATAEEKARITAKLVETAEAVVALDWKLPAEPPFGTRGSFQGFTFDHATRLLVVCRILVEVTGGEVWRQRYTTALHERGGKPVVSRLEACAGGMVFHYTKYHSWTSCGSVAALRILWELEPDAAIRAAYARGLQASADLALKSLPLAAEFDNADTSPFEHDWRVMNAQWKPQHTVAEANEQALAQIRAFMKISPRRRKETDLVREPTAAAWVVTLAPDTAELRQRAEAVKRVIAHYDYSRLIYSQFFWVECAWWRMQGVGD